MQVYEKNQERSTLVLVILTFFVVGISLIFSTWQGLKNQEEIGDKNFYITAHAIFQAVASVIDVNALKSRTTLTALEENFLNELEKDNNLVFVGIIDASGGRILTSGSQEGSLHLSEEALAKMAESGEWSGRTFFDNTPIYIFSRRVLPPQLKSETLFLGITPPKNIERDGFKTGLKNNSPTLQSFPAENMEKGVFLVVGVNISRPLSLYRAFKNNAFFQAFYILLLAILIFILAIRFLAGKDLAVKVFRLEQFQNSLIQNLPDGLITINAMGEIETINPAAVNILLRAFPDMINLLNSNLSEQEVELLSKNEKNYTSVDYIKFSQFFSGKNINILPKVFIDSFCNCMEVQQAEKTLDLSWSQCRLDNFELEILALSLSEDFKKVEKTCGDKLIIIRDRTHLKELEKSLAEAEKLAAVGSLAAGVAHEIRNPLSSLRGFAQLFAKKMLGKEPESSYAQTMVREADRLNRVVTDLLFLSKQSKLNITALNIKEIVNHLETLIKLDLSRHNIVVFNRLEVETIYADYDALSQILLNLVLNSVDAVTESKQKNNLSEPQELKIESEKGTYQGKQGVWLRVKDKGVGFPLELKDKILKPFFSTKGKGTGLGLALVERYVKEHGGTLEIESQEGVGTSVSLFFPDYI
ncbi:His Kinase A (phospho-acceptor) domain-containing protein [Desulfovibrio litoralis DSM 11393]|uniref:histidine kinase n=2 Tax=Desulfovibrio litoralis TaxID=466107 RepID=A0A1M7SNN9_9BACT|nr:His Kinase A (phospho-acceptor) domain-containing protein [Desulfovibrio litoralis DSM 11393]